MYQEDTITISELGKNNNKLNEIADITVYENIPYIEFHMKNYTFSFKVPKEVTKYLSEYK
ncbi:hypothetical protein H1Z61_15850 [Bacillus aquiflavi]|uniref:Uncharacterized protein n=1 Tax=Bacillus aquiflavi TaxID=2672567 RepID=A0A6B3W675_9BACI|nr:hypothetical protein [Bacillus aquiflavi]MBA4538561.1 hypothetical protein [Bacillus aquiflavi]NEY82924.1 hypothetical protein [Bacillus aquiflavi]UAC48026.1 hypothetical protein K6959_15770 [Bacillus aquiflavi]